LPPAKSIDSQFTMRMLRLKMNSNRPTGMPGDEGHASCLWC
jgi:hypothetical protein